MANSSAVSAGDLATSTQYNNLRDDVLNTSTGHIHNGTDARNDAAFNLNVAGLPLTLENTTDGTANQILLLRGDNATRADNDEIYISLSLDDDGGNSTEFVRLSALATDVSDTTEDGQFDVDVQIAGTLTKVAHFNASGLDLAASDALSFNGTNILSDSSGTMTLSNVDALDATTESTIESAIDTLSNLTTVGALGSGSISTGFGAIDNGTSNITTGGILKVDVDGTAENAAGSLTLGAGNDAGVFFDGTDLVVITNGAGASGIKLDAEDDTVEILGSGVLQATFDTGGLNLVSGDGYSIAGTSVLNGTTLGSGVTASSLTSVGTLTALTLGGDIDLDGNNIDNGGVIFLKEQAAADGDVGGSGQIWVKDTTPNELYFTDDAGTDTQLGGGAVTALNNATANELVTVGATTTELDAEANMTFDGTTLTLGNGQIAFPATQNASAGANTLDDYEEGTWTPGVAFGGGTTGLTYSTQTGNYTKVGNRVHCSGIITLSAKGSSTGAATITGLPFTVRNHNGAYSVVGMSIHRVSFNGTPQGQTDINATTVSLSEQPAAGGVQTTLTEGNFEDATDLKISIIYEV